MNPWLLGIGYLLSGIVVCSVVYHLAVRSGSLPSDDGGILVLFVPFWPLLVAAVVLGAVLWCLHGIVTADWPGLAVRAWKAIPQRRIQAAAGPPPCEYCGAPRIAGTNIRTCAATCLIGVDPRLAEHLGLPRWAVTGEAAPPDDAS